MTEWQAERPGAASARVLFLISGLERGGAENQLVGLANGLADRGWSVTVVSFLAFSERSLRSELRRTVTALSLNSPRGALKWWGFARAAAAVRRSRPDLLAGVMFHGMMAARLLGRLLRVPANVSVIQNERERPARERLLGITHRLADAAVALSPAVAEELLRKGVVKTARTEVIPNSIRMDRFDVPGGRETARNGLGVPKGQWVWLAAGRLHVQKDYPNLLRAFAAVLKRHPETLLMIAGDGPLEARIRGWIQRWDLSGRVRMLGVRQDLPELFAACDALALSSAWEGMPVVVLEAMAARRPVVATATGAVPEMIADGDTGIVVPPGDNGALADGMLRLMELPAAERAAMADRARERARSGFSPEAALDRWESLFHRLLGRGAGKPQRTRGRAPA